MYKLQLPALWLIVLQSAARVKSFELTVLEKPAFFWHQGSLPTMESQKSHFTFKFQVYSVSQVGLQAMHIVNCTT